jgi:hypothetical protein
VSKRSGPGGLGSLATAAVTAIALAVQAGLAAVVGVIIAREFGRTAETDGFFAAYGVFIVLALAATAIRLVVLPALARARRDNRLGSETVSWAVALATITIPLVVVAFVAARPLGAVLTGFGPTASRDAATDVLPLMVVAAIAQLYAGLGASALAALDDYVTAAISYIAASCVGLGWILLRIDDDGIRTVAVGMLLNGLVASVLPALALALRARGAAMPPSGLTPIRGARGGRGGHELRVRLSRGRCGRRCRCLVARSCHLRSALSHRSRRGQGRPSRHRFVVDRDCRRRCDRRSLCPRRRADHVHRAGSRLRRPGRR